MKFNLKLFMFCFTIASVSTPEFANVTEKKVVKGIEYDVIHKDVDGDATDSFRITDPKIKIYIDNREGNDAVEFTLYKTGNSDHGSIQWDKVTVPKGSGKTIEMVSGSGQYSYYLCSIEGSVLKIGVKVREIDH